MYFFPPKTVQEAERYAHALQTALSSLVTVVVNGVYVKDGQWFVNLSLVWEETDEAVFVDIDVLLNAQDVFELALGIVTFLNIPEYRKN